MGNVTQTNLEKDYLSEKFGVQGTPLRTEETGHPGLEIIRDKHDIPHIYGSTRADVMFGSGWVAAEDRGLLLKLGLGPAFTAALDVPGVNPFGLLLEARSLNPAKKRPNGSKTRSLRWKKKARPATRSSPTSKTGLTA